MGIGASGNIFIIDRFGIQSGNLFNAGDALSRGHMGQRRCGDDVADGVNALHIGTIVLIHFNAAVLHHDSHLLQTNALGVGGNPHR